jgi:hypothetical protein
MHDVVERLVNGGDGLDSPMRRLLLSVLTGFHDSIISASQNSVRAASQQPSWLWLIPEDN